MVLKTIKGGVQNAYLNLILNVNLIESLVLLPLTYKDVNNCWEKKNNNSDMLNLLLTFCGLKILNSNLKRIKEIALCFIDTWNILEARHITEDQAFGVFIFHYQLLSTSSAWRLCESFGLSGMDWSTIAPHFLLFI